MANKRRLKVRRQTIVPCMTCPLCTNLLVEATTISLCLHTCKLHLDSFFDDSALFLFSRICIYKKLSDGQHDTCPVCDINLGVNPVDKLRPDHNLQFIRAEVFPVNERKAEAPEAVQSVSPPAKRKERSLSSLVSMPGVSVHTSGSSPCLEEHLEEDLLEDHMEKPSSFESLNKTMRKNNLVKSTSRNPAHVKAKPVSANDADMPHVEKNGHKENTQVGKNDIQSATAPSKRKRGRPPNKNTKTSIDSPNLMPVAVRHCQRNVPIWFSLVASEDREGAAHLPQISSGFLRIKDSGMPVSVIQKYIAKRLELFTDEEVQIMFQGQPVLPTLELGDLLKLWRKSGPASRLIETHVGNSGKDYVMVLKYSRKWRAQIPV